MFGSRHWRHVLVGLFVALLATGVRADSLEISVPDLERIAVAANALCETGQDNTTLAGKIVDFSGIDRRKLELRFVPLGPNGRDLTPVIKRTVFITDGAYTSHFTPEMQDLVTFSLLRVMWPLELNALEFFEIRGKEQGALPGDGEIIVAPTALGIKKGSRLLILRAFSFD